MWFALALAAALTQAGQFAVVKGRARSLSPLVIIFGTQTLGLASAMSYLLVRASAGGDISIVGPVLALSPIFAILPDSSSPAPCPAGSGGSVSGCP